MYMAKGFSREIFSESLVIFIIVKLFIHKMSTYSRGNCVILIKDVKRSEKNAEK